MFCVALTGNIASGKSTVATEFTKLGIEVINADRIAKDLADKGRPAFQKIINHFGESVINSDGELNRRHLRQLIVSNANERQWLERLLHPLIRKQIQHEINHAKSPYCLIEIPLLPEKSNYPYLSRVLLVVTEKEQQIARLMARDKCSREQALAIIATQACEDKYRGIADDTLVNNGVVESLKNHVQVLHYQYLRYARKEN